VRGAVGGILAADAAKGILGPIGIERAEVVTGFRVRNESPVNRSESLYA
jgi:hypothetical protein